MTDDASMWLLPDWPAPPRVRACVTTRLLPGISQAPFARFNLGAHCGDDAQAVVANRAMLLTLGRLPAAPRWLRQAHGTEVVAFDTIGLDGHRVDVDAPVADAATTRDAHVVLGILTADCLPVLLCADDGSEIAAVHAGWRGLSGGVIERCIERMHVTPDRLIAWLGPAIGPHSYEVGDDVRDEFCEKAEAAHAFAPTRPGHWRCDLSTLARQRLRALGVARIAGGDFDTFTDPRFYSYRRERQTGRFASLLWLEPDRLRD